MPAKEKRSSSARRNESIQKIYQALEESEKQE
jgi:hypothetical protein